MFSKKFQKNPKRKWRYISRKLTFFMCFGYFEGKFAKVVMNRSGEASFVQSKIGLVRLAIFCKFTDLASR